MNFNVIFVLSVIMSVGQTGMVSSFYSVGPINGDKQSMIPTKESKDSVLSHTEYPWKRTSTCPSGTTPVFWFPGMPVLAYIGVKYFM